VENVTLAVFLLHYITQLLPLLLETWESNILNQRKKENKEKVLKIFLFILEWGKDVGEWKVEIRRRPESILTLFQRKKIGKCLLWVASELRRLDENLRGILKFL
jgi:hypothetical protein